MMECLSDAVRWGNTKIPFRYAYTKRKTLAISVHPDLSVTVQAPLETPIEAIRERIRKRAPWIQRTWWEFELYLPKQPPRRYVNGETHRYLGRQYRLKAMQGETDCVKCMRGYLFVTTKSNCTSERIRQLLHAWYRNHAKQIFQERLEACCQKMAFRGVPVPPLLIRTMSKRWGSCSRSSRIILNVNLIKTPTSCIDYVITHEMCHLREDHHGPRFWRLLNKLMPDYMDRKKLLNSYSEP